MTDPSQVTRLLGQWCSGDPKAIDELLPLVQGSLHQLAARYMRGEHAGHTLQATALVNEAFLRLIEVDVSWQSRAHFIAIAANTMRRILVDHARAARREKRGGDAERVTLYETRIGAEAGPDILELEDALTGLAEVDARKAQIIELSFFGGLTYGEIAEVLGVSEATVDRELRFAKAWLYRELKATGAPA